MALCYRSVVVHKNYSLCLRLVCRNIHVEILLYAYIYIYIYIYIYMYVCIYIYIYIHIYIYICMYVYICTYICMSYYFSFFLRSTRRTYIFTCISFRVRIILPSFSFTISAYSSFRTLSTFFLSLSLSLSLSLILSLSLFLSFCLDVSSFIVPIKRSA